MSDLPRSFDTLGRLSAGFVCAGSTSASCTGGTQAYGFTAQRQGTQVTQSCDTVLNVCNAFGYDEFDRLKSRTVNQGTVQNFTYAYDRYGNRWQQNAPQGGPMLNITFNPGNNIINTSGFTNDVVGNVSNDTFHTYTYDPDGNLTAVDGGSTARYYYDSLNQRVQIAPTRGTYEFVWDIFGRRVSNWQAGTHQFVESNAYTDSGPIAIRAGGYRDYETQNWVGTERVRTSYNGAVSLSVASLPWADQHTPAGDNGDQHDFAGMDRDLEDSTEHAQYRQFSTNLGRWLSPDQYLGSYDFSNPQSFNRYSYALNDPVNLVDPTGLDWCLASVLGFGSCGGPGSSGGDSAPDGYSATGVNTSDGNIIYQNANGDTFIGAAPSAAPASPDTGGASLDWANYVSFGPGELFTPNIDARSGGGGFGPNNAPKPIDWKEVGSCLVDSTLNQYGLTGLTAASGALAIPISKSLVPPFRMIGEPTTNLLSVLGHYVEINVPRITIDGLASTNLLRIAGRANPYVAGALLAIDVGMISYDTYQCYQKQ